MISLFISWKGHDKRSPEHVLDRVLDAFMKDQKTEEPDGRASFNQIDCIYIDNDSGKQKIINVQGKEFNVESHKFYSIPLQESLN